LGGALIAIRGYAAHEAGEAYARALDLCRQVGETQRLFPILGALAGFNLIRGELVAARELAEQLLRLGSGLQKPALLQSAHYGMGEILFELGELRQSRKHLEQAITLYDPRKRRYRAFHDPGVACLAIAALTLCALGYPDQAVKRIRESLSLAQELSHPFSLAFALYVAGQLYQFRREVEATQQHAEALIALSREQRFTLREALGITLRGWALAKQGSEHEGLDQIRQGIAATRATGAKLWQSYFYGLLADACAGIGQPEQGLMALNEALDVAIRTSGREYEAELYRLKGDLLHRHTMTSSGAQAESCFRSAIEVARQQGGKFWELRATTSLARLLGDQGRSDEARAMLAEIYNWFTEGFDTADLIEAKALLDELSV
jgi:predicted ATPase